MKNILCVSLIVIALVIIVLWRVSQLIYAPNLLINAGFDTNELTGWEIRGNVPAQTTPELFRDGAENTTLKLNIPASDQGSWVGVGQQVDIEANQPYKVSINYRLNSETANLSTIILRVSQFDQSGQMITSKDISSPNLVNDPTNNNTHNIWNSLTYTVITDMDAASIEVGVALFGQQDTTTEIDNIVLKKQPIWLKTIIEDPLILLIGLLLASILGYRLQLHQIFIQPFWRKLPGLNGRLVAIVVVNILVFFVCAELSALAIYFARDGKLFYTNKKTYELISRESEEKLTEVIIHPYFGFSGTPGWELDRDLHSFFWKNVDNPYLGTVNNQGFFSDHDYPYIKSNPNQYIIGVFGGSVAEEVALITRDGLIKNLKTDSFFADKEIIVLNFAFGGYKQPQQLLILNYFLSIGQEFDMVINIDGLNEVALDNENNRHNVDIAMPQVGAMNTLINLTDQTTLTPRKLESLAKINAETKKLDNLAILINHNYMASVNFILEQYYKFIFDDYRQEVVRFEDTVSGFSEASLLFVKSSEEVLEGPILFEHIAQNWATSSIMMQQLLISRNILYFHFLQPNQYYSKKIFTDEEIRQAFNANHPYKQAVETGYPVLITHSSILTSNSINFYNAATIFDDKTNQMYRDDCCHYTKQGYEIFVEFIANSILESKDFNERD